MGLSLAVHSHNKHTSLHIDCRNQITVEWILKIALDGHTHHEPAWIGTISLDFEHPRADSYTRLVPFNSLA